MQLTDYEKDIIKEILNKYDSSENSISLEDINIQSKLNLKEIPLKMYLLSLVKSNMLIRSMAKGTYYINLSILQKRNKVALSLDYQITKESKKVLCSVYGMSNFKKIEDYTLRTIIKLYSSSSTINTNSTSNNENKILINRELLYSTTKSTYKNTNHYCSSISFNKKFKLIEKTLIDNGFLFINSNKSSSLKYNIYYEVDIYKIEEYYNSSYNLK